MSADGATGKRLGKGSFTVEVSCCSFPLLDDWNRKDATAEVVTPVLADKRALRFRSRFSGELLALEDLELERELLFELELRLELELLAELELPAELEDDELELPPPFTSAIFFANPDRQVRRTRSPFLILEHDTGALSEFSHSTPPEMEQVSVATVIEELERAVMFPVTRESSFAQPNLEKASTLQATVIIAGTTPKEGIEVG